MTDDDRFFLVVALLLVGLACLVHRAWRIHYRTYRWLGLLAPFLALCALLLGYSSLT